MNDNIKNKRGRFCIKGMVVFALATILFGCLLLEQANRTLEKKIQLHLTELDFQGAVLIAHAGQILFSQGFGMANREHQIQNTPKTVYRIGSISKQFTAVAILQLQEKGLLSIEDPISRYLPDYPQGDKISIKHLLTHTSGIPSITEFPNLLKIQRQYSLPKQTRAHFQDLPLQFVSGTDCYYSDSGYIVLGEIVETVAKMPYESYLKKQILGPLEMDATYYEHNTSIIPNRASGYVKNENGTIRHAAFIDMSFPHAAGALSSTVEDLYKFDCALKGMTLMTKDSLNSMFSIHGSSADNAIAYGYGAMIGSLNQGMEGCESSIIGHFGIIEGFEAALIRYRNEDLTIIILSNQEQAHVESLHKDLAILVRSFWRN